MAIKNGPVIKYYQGVLVAVYGTKSSSHSAADWINEIDADKSLDEAGRGVIFALTAGMVDLKYSLSWRNYNIGAGSAAATTYSIKENYEVYDGEKFFLASGVDLLSLTSGTLLLSNVYKRGENHSIAVIIGTNVLVSKVNDAVF